jgi:hypothetical protein
MAKKFKLPECPTYTAIRLIEQVGGKPLGVNNQV